MVVQNQIKRTSSRELERLHGLVKREKFPHRERTSRRTQAQATVLCLHVGSDRNFTRHGRCRGLAVIGSNQTGATARGLGLHATLAVSEQRSPLGGWRAAGPCRPDRTSLRDPDHSRSARDPCRSGSGEAVDGSRAGNRSPIPWQAPGVVPAHHLARHRSRTGPAPSHLTLEGRRPYPRAQDLMPDSTAPAPNRRTPATRHRRTRRHRLSDHADDAAGTTAPGLAGAVAVLGSGNSSPGCVCRFPRIPASGALGGSLAPARPLGRLSGPQTRLPIRPPTDVAGLAAGVNSPWQKSSRHSTVPASRRTALRLGHILPVCSLIAPCPAGAGTVSVLAGLSPRTVKDQIGLGSFQME